VQQYGAIPKRLDGIHGAREVNPASEVWLSGSLLKLSLEALARFRQGRPCEDELDAWYQCHRLESCVLRLPRFDGGEIESHRLGSADRLEGIRQRNSGVNHRDSTACVPGRIEVPCDRSGKTDHSVAGHERPSGQLTLLPKRKQINMFGDDRNPAGPSSHVRAGAECCNGCHRSSHSPRDHQCRVKVANERSNLPPVTGEIECGSGSVARTSGFKLAGLHVHDGNVDGLGMVRQRTARAGQHGRAIETVQQVEENPLGAAMRSRVRVDQDRLHWLRRISETSVPAQSGGSGVSKLPRRMVAAVASVGWELES
jgi:hypothetical protein